MPPGTDGDTLLTQVVLRGIGDKLYDRRKAAALEVEQLVKNLAREVCVPKAQPSPVQGQAQPVTAVVHTALSICAWCIRATGHP